MSTTTIRLPDELKVRVAQAAERAGTTPHAFILEAIAEKTHDEEQRAAFAATARERFERIVEGGPTVSWSDARRHPVGDDLRELVIGRRGRGFVALYRYVPEAEFVFVLAVRSQKEAGYARF